MLNSVAKRRNSERLDGDVAERDRDDADDATDGKSEPDDKSEADDVDQGPKAKKQRRRVSVSVQALVFGVVILLLTAATATMTWMYLSAQHKLDAQAAQVSNDKRAEQIALDYSVNAAVMDYNDLGPWKDNLVKGTSPELKAKLAKAGTAMEQILTPLQWISTAKPISAKVRSDTDGVYVVDAFVGVMTKTVQAPDSLQSTATYSITVDSHHDWQITDVGGIGGALENK